MTSTNGTYQPDRDDVPKLRDGILEKALSGSSDPRKNSELLELVQCVLPYAIKLIRESFDDTKPRREKAPTTRQMRELQDAQHDALLVHHPDTTTTTFHSSYCYAKVRCKPLSGRSKKRAKADSSAQLQGK